MRRSNRVTEGLWLAAALLSAGAAFGVTALGEHRLSEQNAIDERLRSEVDENEQTLRSRDVVVSERSRLRAQIDRSSGRDPAPVTARFLRDAARAAEARHAAIASVAAAGSLAGPPGRVPIADVIPLDVTVEGRYVDVLEVIRTLSELRVPAEVRLVSLVRVTQPGSSAVTAALHVLLQRIRPARLSDVRPGPA